MGKNGFILLTATSLLFASAMADTTAELDAAPTSNGRGHYCGCPRTC